MKLHLKIALLVGVLALAAAPAAAPAAQPAEPGNGHKPAEPGNGHKPAEPAGGHVPAEPGNGQGTAKPGNGPEYSPAPPTTKAFGYYCRTEKRTHEAGVPGTPFSKCVKAHAQAAAHPHMSARRACKALIEKHVPKSDKKGTAFSRCVVGVNEERKKEREATA